MRYYDKIERNTFLLFKLISKHLIVVLFCMKKILLILIFFFSTQLASSQECNLTPQKGTKNYIIGYGSLMEKESRTRTNKSAFVVKPVLIKDFKRTWGQNGGIYKITFLTILKKKVLRLMQSIIQFHLKI